MDGGFRDQRIVFLNNDTYTNLKEKTMNFLNLNLLMLEIVLVQ